MAYITPVQDYEIYRRYDFSQTFTYKNGGNPVDLSSHTVISQIWNEERTKKYMDFTCEILSPASNGQFKISLTDTQTINLPDVAHYDIRLTIGNNSKNFIRGKIKTYEGYSA